MELSIKKELTVVSIIVDELSNNETKVKLIRALM